MSSIYLSPIETLRAQLEEERAENRRLRARNSRHIETEVALEGRVAVLEQQLAGETDELRRREEQVSALMATIERLVPDAA